MADGVEARLAARLETRLAADPAFLAWALARFRAAEGLDQAALAAWLGVAPDRLPRLALCLRPRAEAFGADCDDLAARFGADPARLADLLRRVDALAALARARAPAEAGGLLAAARDRDDMPAEGDGAEEDGDSAAGSGPPPNRPEDR
jgi:hypothetical protein